jgi:hypothetical protein
LRRLERKKALSEDLDLPREAELNDGELDEHERFWNLVDRICDEHGLPARGERARVKSDVR